MQPTVHWSVQGAVRRRVGAGASFLSPVPRLLPIASLQLLASKMAGSSGARLAGLLVAVLLVAVHSQARELKGRNLLQCEVSSTAVAGSSR